VEERRDVTEKPVFKQVQALDDDDRWMTLFLKVSAIELIEGPVEMHWELGAMTPNGVVHTLWVSTLTLTSGRKVRVFTADGWEPLAETLGITID
jgi:hypothetical protein